MNNVLLCFGPGCQEIGDENVEQKSIEDEPNYGRHQYALDTMLADADQRNNSESESKAHNYEGKRLKEKPRTRMVSVAENA